MGDERRREPHVLLPDPQAGRQEEQIHRLRPHGHTRLEEVKRAHAIAYATALPPFLSLPRFTFRLPFLFFFLTTPCLIDLTLALNSNLYVSGAFVWHAGRKLALQRTGVSFRSPFHAKP